jgi:integrase
MPVIKHNRLTDREVRNLRNPGLYADGGGLYLQITNQNAKSWMYRYPSGGKTREMGLGSLRDVTLADAREARNDARKLLRRGSDPIAQRKAEKEASRRANSVAVVEARTVEEVWREWSKELLLGETSYLHRSTCCRVAELHILPKFGLLPIRSITPLQLRDHLLSLKAKHKDVPRRVRDLLNRMFRYAANNDYVLINPVDRIDTKLVKPSTENYARLEPADAPAFMTRLREVDHMAARGAELVMLSGMRVSVVRNAKWDDFDLTGELWNIPKDTRGLKKLLEGTPLKHFRVPITERMRGVLDILATERRNSYILPGFYAGDRPINDGVLPAVCYPLVDYKITIHGFRSTFRDWAGEQVGLADWETCELAIGHKVGNKASRAYMRSDLLERRIPLMKAWDAYCCA